jgi:hypothetical protein
MGVVDKLRSLLPTELVPASPKVGIFTRLRLATCYKKNQRTSEWGGGVEQDHAATRSAALSFSSTRNPKMSNCVAIHKQGNQVEVEEVAIRTQHPLLFSTATQRHLALRPQFGKL